LLLLLTKINLGAQKEKNLRTPHSKITAPKTTYDDKFTVLLHKSQEFLAVISECSGEYFDMCPCHAENRMVLGPKWLRKCSPAMNFCASIPAYLFLRFNCKRVAGFISYQPANFFAVEPFLINEILRKIAAENQTPCRTVE